MTSATVAHVRRPRPVRFLGRPAGRPVLLLSGPEGRPETWRGLIPHLTADHLVVLADQAEDAHLGVHEDPGALLGLLHRLDLTDIVLVAHAAHARTGALAAQQDPSRFRVLVLVSPGVDGRDLPPVSVPILRLERHDLLDPARIAQEVRRSATP